MLSPYRHYSLQEGTLVLLTQSEALEGVFNRLHLVFLGDAGVHSHVRVEPEVLPRREGGDEKVFLWVGVGECG